MQLSQEYRPSFVSNEELIRLGSRFDGGYVVLKKQIKETNCLVSFGISDNWDFEEEFHNLSNCEVDAYDYSIDKNFWLDRFKKDLVKFLCLKIFKPKKIKNMFKYFFFKSFFNKKTNSFNKEKIGNKDGELSFNSIMQKHREKKIFLKSDIEGGEFSFYKDIEKFDNIIGIAIEFHNVIEKNELIKNFLQNLKKFKLIHIHANNLVPVNNSSHCLEMTFARNEYLDNSETSNNKKYPIKGLDYPNAKRGKDIEIYFL